ncbi:hypothetical protein MAR_021659 [Mya arenaria]|uniref:DNA-directed DNA polymerase n=1 Tax=Mya arenaria TaxID=6604 RepID=A0ABY7E8D6_MYAAR|nr:hypothetical protein MAR_021659 [Mya arenaria]
MLFEISRVVHGFNRPVQECITIASACHLVYRTNFLEHESIAVIPPHGYRPEEKQSTMAYQWMSYLAHTKQINIQHGRNMGERHIGPFKVDGYYETDSGKKVVMEFHEWVYNDDFIEASARTNDIIAAYTTAHARLKLYGYLKQLDRRVFYCDTDSIVFKTAPGQWEPPLGDYLGDLTDEVPNNKITAFVTGGPKNYAFKLSCPNKKGQKSICKVRGITLNFKTSIDINNQTVKDMVTGHSNVDHTSVIDENRIVRNPSTGHVLTKREIKDYIVFDKRVIKYDYQTVPYGI